MAKIFMSMSGEGRGHATRVRSTVERMRDRHEITLFAPGDAYRFLEPQYGNDPDVRLIEIPGLKFHYVDGNIHLTKTIYQGFYYQNSHLPKLVQQLVDEIEKHQPDVILTDFEPALPRAAKKCGKPFLSMTHQHFLVAYDLSILPMHLRFFACFIGLAVPMHYTAQKETIISSFFKADLKPRWKKKGAVCVGPMIRPEVRQDKFPVVSPETGSSDSGQPPFLLSYLRKQAKTDVVDILKESPIPVKVYGLGEREPLGAITFHEIHPQHFVDDLLACHGVVSASGNQLLGECMYLGKPVLGIPETWHHEQLINAHFLKAMGCGDFVTIEKFQLKHLQNFLEHIEEYRTKILETCLGNDGTDDTIAIIERNIPVEIRRKVEVAG
ncbi:MAG TPA: teichoic acid biosynthesis protein [Planctomycetaceae bacterium]|nr:teichoic acid biosynthesis protein [Planctomycetaceae bacterium]